MSPSEEPTTGDASVRSQPLPLANAILWGPASAGAPQPFERPYPIFMHQTPLGQIISHTRSAPAKTLLGFLLGQRYKCPESGIRYVVIDEILRVGADAPGDQTSPLLARLWPPLMQKLQAGPPALIGWYHNHPAGSLALSREDVGTHMMYFKEPWMVGLVLGADEGKPAAAWFRASDEDNWHDIQLPFYELVAPESAASGGKKRSFVPWGNFKSYRPVPPRPKRPTPPPDSEAPRASIAGFQASPMMEQATAAPPSRYGLPAQEEEPESADRWSSAATRTSGAVRRPRVVEERAPTVAAARAWSWQLLAGGVAGALLVSVVLGAGWALGMVHFGRSGGTASGPPAAEAPSGGAAASQGASVDPTLANLDRLTDSVQIALRGYHDRRTGFDRKRADCAALAQSLVGVEELWMAYNTRGKPRDLVLDADRAARDRSLYAQVDSIENDFDRSACPRP